MSRQVVVLDFNFIMIDDNTMDESFEKIEAVFIVLVFI